jgi:hypothetical protein
MPGYWRPVPQSGCPGTIERHWRDLQYDESYPGRKGPTPAMVG